MSTDRKYAFSWDSSIGNLDIARKSLGPLTRVEVYRLFQFTLRDVLEQHYGADHSDNLLREAGCLAGKAFFEHFCGGITDLGELVKTLQERFKEFGIGILRIEKSDVENLKFILTVDEDLDCSGLPDTTDVICVYDEGFIQGILQAFTGKNFQVREVDCWCTGDCTCRFTADVVSGD